MPPPRSSAPVHPEPPSAVGAQPPALPLPQVAEPLITQAPDPAPLARNRSLALPGVGLLGALNGWLRSTGQRLLSGFFVKKLRRPAPSSLRERVELTQLRAENRRLRHQLDGMVDRRGHGDILSRAHQRDDMTD